MKSKCCKQEIIGGYCPHAKEKIYFCGGCKQPAERKDTKELKKDIKSGKKNR